MDFFKKGTDFLSDIAGNLEKEFGGLIGSLTSEEIGTKAPAINIAEKGDRFIVWVAAPGMEKKDFQLSIKDGALMVAMDKELTPEQKKLKYVQQEFSYNTFKRAFAIPETVDPALISAAYENGLLEITLLKKEEARESDGHQIDIF
ncbi:MAG: Hsp20/alpha crystallin family protein [Chitinophagales bacterium]